MTHGCGLVDDSNDSLNAIDLLKRLDIEYVEYTLFAVEGIYKGLEKINEYTSLKKDADFVVEVLIILLLLSIILDVIVLRPVQQHARLLHLICSIVIRNKSALNHIR
jgi:hypothetical protein